MQKAQDNAPQGTPAPRVDPSSPTDLPAGSGTMLSGLQALAPGLLDFDPANWSTSSPRWSRTTPPRCCGRSRGSRGRLRRRRARPRREHRHPFLTARYGWITGDDLSLLDLIALVLAVPVHLAYAVFTVATTGSMREFGRDAAGLAAAMKPAPALGVAGRTMPTPRWAQAIPPPSRTQAQRSPSPSCV